MIARTRNRFGAAGDASISAAPLRTVFLQALRIRVDEVAFFCSINSFSREAILFSEIGAAAGATGPCCWAAHTETHASKTARQATWKHRDVVSIFKRYFPSFMLNAFI